MYKQKEKIPQKNIIKKKITLHEKMQVTLFQIFFLGLAFCSDLEPYCWPGQ
jgi:hypothetical protein